MAGTPLAALGGGSHGAYVASLGAMAAALLCLEGLLAARALRRWPESFPLPLNWREELDRGRHMADARRLTKACRCGMMPVLCAINLLKESSEAA